MSSQSVEWSVIAARLAPARSYWIGTTSRDRSPHVAPVWGVIVDDVFYFYSERRTVKARNLLADARAVIHLGDGDDVLIVQGSMRDLGRPQSMPTVMDAFDAKYVQPSDAEYLPSADPSFDVLYALDPVSARLWAMDDWAGSQRRWPPR